jgi:hypothetical protein
LQNSGSLEGEASVRGILSGASRYATKINNQNISIKFLQTSRSIPASVWAPDSLLSMHGFLRQEGGGHAG